MKEFLRKMTGWVDCHKVAANYLWSSCSPAQGSRLNRACFDFGQRMRQYLAQLGHEVGETCRAIGPKPVWLGPMTLHVLTEDKIRLLQSPNGLWRTEGVDKVLDNIIEQSRSSLNNLSRAFEQGEGILLQGRKQYRVLRKPTRASWRIVARTLDAYAQGWSPPQARVFATPHVPGLYNWLRTGQDPKESLILLAVPQKVRPRDQRRENTEAHQDPIVAMSHDNPESLAIRRITDPAGEYARGIAARAKALEF